MQDMTKLFAALVVSLSIIASPLSALATVPSGYGGGGDPVSCQLFATPDEIAVGGGTTLTWNVSSNVVSAFLTPKNSMSWMQNVPLDGSWFISGILDTRSYTLHVTGPEGQTATCDVTVTVESSTPVPLTCDIVAVPSTIGPNGSTTLQWTTSASAVSAVLHPKGSTSWSQNVPLNGSWFISGIINTRTYSLTVTDSNGATYTCDAPIVVAVDETPIPGDPGEPLPTCSMAASPDTIASNGGTSLVWSSSAGVTYAKLHPTGSTSYFATVTPNGSWWISGITNSRSYSVTVFTASGLSATCDAPITVSDV